MTTLNKWNLSGETEKSPTLKSAFINYPIFWEWEYLTKFQLMINYSISWNATGTSWKLAIMVPNKQTANLAMLILSKSSCKSCKESHTFKTALVKTFCNMAIFTTVFTITFCVTSNLLGKCHFAYMSWFVLQIYS